MEGDRDRPVGRARPPAVVGRVRLGLGDPAAVAESDPGETPALLVKLLVAVVAVLLMVGASWILLQNVFKVV